MRCFLSHAHLPIAGRSSMWARANQRGPAGECSSTRPSGRAWATAAGMMSNAPGCNVRIAPHLSGTTGEKPLRLPLKVSLMNCSTGA